MFESYTAAVYFANTWHQTETYLWFPPPIQWNSKILQWQFRQKCTKRYTPSQFLVKFFTAFCCILGLLHGQLHPEAVSKARLVALALQIFGMIMFILTDYVIHSDGADLAVSCNWAYTKEKWCRKHGRNRLPFLCVLLTNGFVIWISTISTIIPIGAALENLDPFLIPTGYPGAEFSRSLQGTVFRCFIYTYLIKVSLTSFRCLYMTAFVTALYRIEMLFAMSFWLPKRENVALYKENAMVARIMYDNELKGSWFALTGIYFGIILSVNIILVALEREQHVLLGMAGMFMVSNYLVLQIFFGVGCSFFNHSCRIFNRWNKELIKVYKTGAERREFRMVLRSLRVVSVPAGGVGIIDRDIKVNYSDNLLGNLVDLIITRKSLLA